MTERNHMRAWPLFLWRLAECDSSPRGSTVQAGALEDPKAVENLAAKIAALKNERDAEKSARLQEQQRLEDDVEETDWWAIKIDLVDGYGSHCN